MARARLMSSTETGSPTPNPRRFQCWLNPSLGSSEPFNRRQATSQESSDASGLRGDAWRLSMICTFSEYLNAPFVGVPVFFFPPWRPWMSFSQSLDASFRITVPGRTDSIARGERRWLPPKPRFSSSTNCDQRGANRRDWPACRPIYLCGASTSLAPGTTT
jgi:hypothetical protein